MYLELCARLQDTVSAIGTTGRSPPVPVAVCSRQPSSVATSAALLDPSFRTYPFCRFPASCRSNFPAYSMKKVEKCSV